DRRRRQPGPAGQPRRVRRPMRRQPDRGILRQDRPAPLLNRGGDRRANSALYTVVFTRLGRDPRTRDYANRRTTEGKSTKEIIRCLKRYVARELFPIIAMPLAPAQTPPAITRQTPRHHAPSPARRSPTATAPTPP